MGDYYKPFDSVTQSGGEGGFGNWYNQLDDTKKNALTTGLITTGLSMMEQGGRTYDRPVSGLSIAGSAGLKGVDAFKNTIETERGNIARDRGLKMSEDYLGLSKERNVREGKAFDAESPYLAQKAKDSAELGGLRVGLTKSEIVKNEAIAASKGLVNTDKQKKAQLDRGVKASEYVYKQLASNTSGALRTAFLSGNATAIQQAFAADPSQRAKVLAVINKPGNEKLKQILESGERDIASAMGVESAVDTQKTPSKSSNAEDYAAELSDFSLE